RQIGKEREAKADNQRAGNRDDRIQNRVPRRMPKTPIVEGSRVVGEGDERLRGGRIGVVDGVQAVPEQRRDWIDDNDQQQRRRGQQQQRSERALGQIFPCYEHISARMATCGSSSRGSARPLSWF